MRVESREILEKAIRGKGSPLFLSKNARQIGKYLKKKGFDVGQSEIKEYLAEQKSNDILIKNDSKRKASELSRPWILPPNYFEWLNVGLCHLSKNRSYGSSSPRYVLVMVCGLSLYSYFSCCYSTKSNSVIKSFEDIFRRSPYLPERARKIWGDLGVEWLSNAITQYFKSKGLKFYGIRPRRLERKGKGNVVCEQSIRLFRSYLEVYMRDIGNDVPFAQKLLEIENAVNSKPRSSLNFMSSKEALNQDPRHIRNIKAGNRFRRRKSLRNNMIRPTKLPLFAIVKVRKFAPKDGMFAKESYGSISTNYYCVTDIVNIEFVNYHLLSSVFNLAPVSDSRFSCAELKYYAELSLPKARYLNVLYSSEVVKRDDVYVYLKPQNCDETFYCTKNALN